MPRSLLRRAVAAFVFTLLLAAVAASAAPRPSSPNASPGFCFEPRGALAFVWQALSHLWSKAGGSLDPDGKPQTGQPTDEGSSLDPSGMNANGEAGSSLDPSGGR